MHPDPRDPRVWGKHFWLTMLYAAAGYDLNDTPPHKKNPYYKAFFQSLKGVLPCSSCRSSYDRLFDEMDIDSYLLEPHGLLRFVYDLKNRVTEKIVNQRNDEYESEYHRLMTDPPTTQEEYNERLQSLTDILEDFPKEPVPTWEDILLQFSPHHH